MATARSGKSLMFIGNAMNQPASTMPNPYNGDVVDGAKYDLPGECVMGKGASEQKANLAAYLHAMETVIASKVPINGKLIFTCCLSGETGKHDAIKSVVEGAGVRADMAVLGGTGLKITLGNRGRIDVFVTVKGSPCHSARPWDGANAITGAMEAIRLLLSKTKLDKSHPQLGKQTLTVNHFQSFPNSTHTVQERVEFRSTAACFRARTPMRPSPSWSASPRRWSSSRTRSAARASQSTCGSGRSCIRRW